MKDDPDCPGCHTEMEEDRVDGDGESSDARRGAALRSSARSLATWEG
jgi:hypothetical protein